ncbi:hypothetical protein VCCP1035_0768 [Vibrio cholerae CP1035(8)]|nr:hypothetical protein VCCP1035_0768 [Vibrio cholerae CP1035(8)]
MLTVGISKYKGKVDTLPFEYLCTFSLIKDQLAAFFGQK